MVGVDKINKWATAARPRREERHRPADEVHGPRAVHRVEARSAAARSGTPGETISVGIGQGAVSVTPVSMAVYMATLANGGTRVTPHLLKAVDDGDGWQAVPPPPPQSTVDSNPRRCRRSATASGWSSTATAPATARASRAGTSSGKTGTAQVISNQGKAAAGQTTQDLRDNGWFVFFAPRDNPQIAGVVFCEHGDARGNAAAIVAHHVLETFFAKQDGRPLPPPLKVETPLAAPAGGDDPPPDPVPVAPPLPAVAGGAQ